MKHRHATMLGIICLALLLAIASANTKSAAARLSKARELRQRLAYTSDPARANQLRHRRAQILDVYTGNGFSFSQIFGLSITEFDQILSSDVADEFGARDTGLGIDRAEELWEDSANYQLDLAIEAEERWVSGDADYGRGDAEYPYIICSKKPRKSALQRKNQIVNIVIFGAEDEEYDEDKLFTSEYCIYNFDILLVIIVLRLVLTHHSYSYFVSVYNDKEMTCFGTRFLASTALTIADLQDPELPLLPIGASIKLRAGAIAEVLERAGIDVDLDVPIDESIFRENDSVQSSQTRIEVALCSGADDDELRRMGRRLLDFLNLVDEDDPSRSEVASQNIYADLTDAELRQMPARSRFWRRVFETGIDSPEGCQETFDRLIFEVQASGDAGEMAGFYVSLGAKTGSGSSDFQTIVSCVLSTIAGMSLLPQVCSVDLNPLITTNNVDASAILQDPVNMNYPFYDAGITGKGQVIGVSDSGLDTDNCYVWDSSGDIRKNGSVDTSRRKVIQYDDFVDAKDDPSGHGTHVVGTIVGHRAVDGRTESDGIADGVAKDAKVAFFDCGAGGDSLSIPADKGRYLGVGTSAGARIHSSSWGSFLVPPKYDSMTRDTDSYIYNDWSFLQIVAAGNSGTGNKEKTIGSPAVAKNVLTVGASQNPTNKGIEYLADFSSRGPTSDGRIKPDVVAPGQSVLSMNAVPDEQGECDPDAVPLSFNGGTGSAEGVLYLQGTSMATPAVSGGAALVRQYFLDGFYNSSSIDISGMLLKAILINGAVEISYIDNAFRSTPTQYYDNNQGFGRVSLVDSLPLDGANTFGASFIDKATIQDGQTLAIDFNITDNGGRCTENEFRATLTWADPPGATGCVRCLVNDLDLSVQKLGSSRIYYPNGRGSRDTINNVERVIMGTVPGDTIRVTITAANLDRAEQPFALYVTGCTPNRSYSGEAKPKGNVDRTTRILIIVCSVIGFLLLFLAVCWMMDSRKRKRHQEQRAKQAAAGTGGASRPVSQAHAHGGHDNGHSHGENGGQHYHHTHQEQPTGRY